MNTEFFIAKRIYSNKKGDRKTTPPAVKIAVTSIALGITMMILSVAIVTGFKHGVREKVIGFGSHIQISNFDSNASYETNPIVFSDTIQKEIQSMDNIAHLQRYATKPGVIKTKNDYMGVIFKGIGPEYDWMFFRQNMLEGKILELDKGSESSRNVIISKYIADKMNLKLGDSFLTYFVQDNIKVRKFIITGIYQTNFSEYDKTFIICDIKQIQKLNAWTRDEISGMEILVKDYDRLDATTNAVYDKLLYKRDRLQNAFQTHSIKQINPSLFAWLDVLNVNVIVIIILMLVVAGFSMISGLLIIILDRANMIGILKSMGSRNSNIRKIFLYVAAFLIVKGLFWGNIIALTICFLQKYFGIIKLDPVVYYLSTVPVELNLWSILSLNIGTLFICLLMLIGPSYIIAKISPAKTIKFE